MIIYVHDNLEPNFSVVDSYNEQYPFEVMDAECEMVAVSRNREYAEMICAALNSLPERSRMVPYDDSTLQTTPPTDIHQEPTEDQPGEEDCPYCY